MTPADGLGTSKTRATLACGFRADVNEACIFLFLWKVLLTPCLFQSSMAIFYVTAAAPVASGSFASPPSTYSGCLAFPSCCIVQLFGICFQNAPSVFVLNLQMDTRWFPVSFKAVSVGESILYPLRK